MHQSKGISLSSLYKVVVLVFIFGIFPVFVAVVSLNYKHKAETLIETQNPTSDELILDNTGLGLGGMKILTENQSSTLKKVKSFLIGKWVSLQDKGYTVEFQANSTFIDKDQGKAVAYGTWGGFVSATSSSNIEISNPDNQNIQGIDDTDTTYYLSKVHTEDKYKDQKFLYEIMQLDEDRVILYYTGNSKILYFTRATSTTP